MPDANIHDANHFAIPEHLCAEALSFDGGSVTIHASKMKSAAECPLCGPPSRRVHGRYARTLGDLPWGGVPVRLRVRKFFCDEPSCQRRIFAERLEGVASAYARGTDRRREALEWIAFALGGEAGARLARELGLLVSPDTLLNRIRGPPVATPRKCAWWAWTTSVSGGATPQAPSWWTSNAVGWSTSSRGTRQGP